MHHKITVKRILLVLGILTIVNVFLAFAAAKVPTTPPKKTPYEQYCDRMRSAGLIPLSHEGWLAAAFDEDSLECKYDEYLRDARDNGKIRFGFETWRRVTEFSKAGS